MDSEVSRLMGLYAEKFSSGLPAFGITPQTATSHCWEKQEASQFRFLILIAWFNFILHGGNTGVLEK